MPFDGTQLSEVTKTLIKGKKRIEKGWCQKSYRLNDRVCMLGAIGGWQFDIEAARYLIAAISSDSSVRTSLSAWNDSHTQSEVLAAFDRAIELSVQD